jgi:hypothetical protein
MDALLCPGACESSLGCAVVGGTENSVLVAVVRAVLCMGGKISTFNQQLSDKALERKGVRSPSNGRR